MDEEEKLAAAAAAQASAESGGAPAEAVIAEEQPLKGRARMRSMLKEKFPEKEYADDGEDDIDDFIAGHEELRGNHDKLKGLNERLGEGVNKNPHIAALINAFLDGEDANKPMARIIASLKDGFTEDDIAEALKETEAEAREKLDAEARTKQQKDEFDANIAASSEELKAFQEEEGMNDEEYNKFYEDFLTNFLLPISIGKITKQTLQQAKKAMTFDNEVASALAAGKVAGANDKIKSGKKNTVSDGLPNLGGGGAAPKGDDENPNESVIRKMFKEYK
ncbi:hypothetical protein AGMMS49965_13220 [Bacteroidia bacterium]|nr:hypothetical protein AGMMS49965_13220 [Bacteroidia bacterium]